MKLNEMTAPIVLLNDGHRQGPVCIMVSQFKGRTLVRLSRCWLNRDNEPQPGGVGFSLDVADFGTFSTAFQRFLNDQRTAAKPKAGKPQPANATA